MELHGRAPPQLLGKLILAATLSDAQVSKLAPFFFNVIQGYMKRKQESKNKILPSHLINI
jgi:hypothetical protein